MNAKQQINYKSDLPKDNTLTVNLSNLTLNNTDIKLLDKGLSFIPTFNSMPLFKFYESQNRLIRNLKLRDYFSKYTDTNNKVSLQDKFKEPSTWTPPDHHISQDTLDTIQSIVSTTEEILNTCKKDKHNTRIFFNDKHNLTNSDKLALDNLRNNRSIIIKPADKGGATVIMNRSAYLTEAYRQLNNVNYYRKLDKPIFKDNIPKINAILNNMLKDKVINSKQFKFLQAKESDGERTFYLLPKIHKPREKWPQPDMPEGRPIVSDCNSESYRVSQFIDSHIRPISMQHPAFIKDTYDFINKIRNQVIPSTALLVTGDVTALYTNMQFDRTLTAVQRALDNAGFGHKLKGYILDLLNLTLKNNDFSFNGEFFLQICGTAMGKCYAPALADLYMQEIDYNACEGPFSNLIKLFFRFLDDIFFVWLGSRDQLKNLETFLNNIIPGIKITFNISEVDINFLDTTIYKTTIQDNSTLLYTKVFFKDTDTHQLLHKESFHPRHTFRGIIKSQLLRFKRISSTQNDYNHTCSTLFAALCKRGYSRSMLRKMKRDVWQSTDAIGQPKPKQDIGIPVVIPFSKAGSLLASNWKSFIKLNTKFYDTRLITAFSNSSNLCKRLVSSTLIKRTDDSINKTTITHSTGNKGMFKCNNIRCKACNYIIADKQFQSSYNKRKFNITHHINCKSINIVYLITCKKCGKQYVGQTGRSLADRINDHLSRIRTRKSTPVGLHFNLSNHSISDIEFTAIEQVSMCGNPTKILLIKETTWQHLLQTSFPLGFNNLKPEYLV